MSIRRTSRVTRSVSFLELLRRVRRAARGYVALGLEPGDRVCVWAPNSIGWVVAGLAVSYAGGVLVPLNSRYIGHEVAEVVDRTGAAIVVVDDGFLGRTQVADLSAASDLAAVLAVIDLTDLADLDMGAVTAAEIDLIAESVPEDDVADILFTSGTTGRGKGAMSAHRQTVGVARAWGELGGVTGQDRYLVVNPFFHSFGYKVGIVVGLLTGSTLYPVATFDLDETMRLIETERITVLPGAPTIFTSLLNAPGRDQRDLSSLRLAVTGAAVVPVVLIERMRDEPGHRPGRHRLRHDRGGRGHDVPGGRLRRDRRHHLRPRRPRHGDPHRRDATASCWCAATT